MTTERHASVWDALGESPEAAENLKIRAALMISVAWEPRAGRRFVVCGDCLWGPTQLLRSCAGREGGAPGHEQAETLRIRASRQAAFECYIGRALCIAMQLP